MTHDGRTEIRIELPAADLAVLDGYCNATGRTRTDVMRTILEEWSRVRLHEATVICRVVGVNPLASDIDRHRPHHA
jgi:hypothetical protein